MACASLKFVCFAAVAVGAVEPNPPVWPASVQVFGPESSTKEIDSAVQEAFTTNGGSDENGQFSSSRFAFLFKPGSYDVDVPVGYYTQVAGLGAKPTDVIFTSSKGVYCEEASFSVSPGALDTFWRSAENFQTNADYSWNGDGSYGMLWAASQATPIRSIAVSNDLTLYQYTGGNAAGYSSGGFMSNMRVNGSVKFGSQQQYLTRSSTLGNVEDGVWNMVFVGAEGAPSNHCGADNTLCIHPYVTVDETTVAAEKPFIVIDDQGLYSLTVPLVKLQSKGHILEPAARTVNFESVYVASADVDTADSINAKLADGLDVVLAPGIYNLSSPLQITTANQVLLGLGLATLSPTNGTAVIQVANVPGVRIAGLLIQAGSEPTEALLEWGEGTYAGDASNPGFLHDVFVRVGGPTVPMNAQSRIMVRINAGNVVGDNIWLWRADHVEGGGLTTDGNLPCDTAIVVNGEDVTMYGLAAEHTLQDIVQWNGDRGTTFFFQAEFPYDVTQAYGDSGYVGYRVGSTVTEHAAFGVGVYHFFRDYAVTVQSAISTPTAIASSFSAPLSVYLNGKGVVKHIINDLGSSSQSSGSGGAVPVWLCATLDEIVSVGNGTGTCAVGSSVYCPGSTAQCAGNECCGDGSTCPSAQEDFQCCPLPKTEDCVVSVPTPPPTPAPPTPPPAPTPPPTPAPPTAPTVAPTMGPCLVGASVYCPGTTTLCAGDQCCMDGSTCPSAKDSFTGCPEPKTVDCTTSGDFVV